RAPAANATTGPACTHAGPSLGPRGPENVHSALTTGRGSIQPMPVAERVSNGTERSTTPKELRAAGLVKRYGRRTVVNGVDLALRQGEIVALLGPNGAGKTTSFYMIVGFVRPNGGRIELGEREITNLPMHRRAKLGLGYL